MFQSLFGSKRAAFRAALSALVLALASTIVSTPAQARRHHHGAHRVHAQIHPHAHHRPHARHHAPVAAGITGGATAAIAVDGATGHVIWGMNEHAPRHPASVTKVMTLYLLFEQLERGKLALDDEIPISAHAAAQKPSKLGLPPGRSIRVEDAIKVVVTKSANDIAVAIAEAVGGSESEFAELMTRKAHALGMAHTTYRNASGLPNDEQITTAYDLAILGRDIQARFPRYYRYFSLHEVAWHGQRIHNHNRLMDRVEGMDGIKTGYTVASGFNLLSSVKRDGHYLISVVMGGRSAPARDAYMERLIEAHIDDAGGRGATQVAERESESEAEPERPVEPARQVAPARKAEPAPEPTVLHAQANADSRGDTRPQPVLPVEPPRLQLAAVAPVPRPAYVAAVPQPARDEKADRARPAADGSTRQAHDAAGAATPGGLRWITGAPPKPKLETRIETKVEARAAPRDEGQTVKARDQAESVKETAKVASAKPAVSGWILQIGATDDADKALALLKSAKEKRSALLASARPYTEAVHSGKGTLFRARFAGLEESRAEAACKALKSSGFSCFAVRD